MVRKELNLSCLPSYKVLKHPTTAGIPTTISNNFLHRDPKAFSTWMYSTGLIWINGFQIIKTGFLTNTVPLRLNHAAISGSSHPILLQFKYAISQQKAGIVFNFICLYLWKKKAPNNGHQKTRYQYFIQRYNSGQYLLFCNMEKSQTESSMNSML